MQQVVNIQDIESILDQHGELIVKKNSKNNVVVMSIEEYKKQKLENEIEEKLLKSEDDIEHGRTQDAIRVFEELEQEYGF